VHPRKDDLRLLLQTGLSPRNHFDHDRLPRHRLRPSSDHARTTHLYYDYNAVRDRRGRTTRAGAADVSAALHRLMDTDEAMDDADAHVYTTTIIMHEEREAKTEDDDHNSLIGGTLAS